LTPLVALTLLIRVVRHLRRHEPAQA